MNVFIIIVSILFWLGSLWCLYGRQTIAPALSYMGLLILSFSNTFGMMINTTMLIGWLAMTLVVMFAAYMQPEPVRRQTKGMPFMIGGGIVGMALGLLGFTASSAITLRYSLMIVAVAAGIFLGFLLYTNTPDGRPVRPGSGNFFRYLLAKGFPTAITLMQMGVALVLLMVIKNVNGL